LCVAVTLNYTLDRVAVFDLDGTITRVDTYVHFLLAVVRRHPLRALRGLWLPLAVGVHRAGWRDNAWLKCVFLASIAGGLKRECVDVIVESFVKRFIDKHIRPGAKAALKRHRAAGHRIVLATASLDFYVSGLARELGVDEIVCTGSVWTADSLVAELRPRNCYGEEKLRRLVELLGEGVQRPYVYAYTDHYSDRALLDWANEGIAVNPDARLRKYCGRRGYRVVDWEEIA
jgi:phosphatidylglycerophosphatase C